MAFEDARNPFQAFYFGFEESAEKFRQGVWVESSEQRAEWGIPCSKASAPDTLIVKIALGADAERPLALDVTWRVDSGE